MRRRSHKENTEGEGKRTKKEPQTLPHPMGGRRLRLSGSEARGYLGGIIALQEAQG